MRMHPELLTDLSSSTYLLNRTLPVRDPYHSAAMNSITGWLLDVSVAVVCEMKIHLGLLLYFICGVNWFPWLHALPSYCQLCRCWWVQVAIICNLSQKADHRPLALYRQRHAEIGWPYCTSVVLWVSSKNLPRTSEQVPTAAGLVTYVLQVTPSVILYTRSADSEVRIEVLRYGSPSIGKGGIRHNWNILLQALNVLPCPNPDMLDCLFVAVNIQLLLWKCLCTKKPFTLAWPSETFPTSQSCKGFRSPYCSRGDQWLWPCVVSGYLLASLPPTHCPRRPSIHYHLWIWLPLLPTQVPCDAPKEVNVTIQRWNPVTSLCETEYQFFLEQSSVNSDPCANTVDWVEWTCQCSLTPDMPVVPPLTKPRRIRPIINTIS